MLSSPETQQKNRFQNCLAKPKYVTEPYRGELHLQGRTARKKRKYLEPGGGWDKYVKLVMPSMTFGQVDLLMILVTLPEKVLACPIRDFGTELV